MRLSSDFWVSAYLRQCQIAGDFAGLVRRGASQGGAIFVKINRLDGTADLFGPAIQALVSFETDERLFSCLLESASEEKIEERIEKEMRFDNDLWLVERESRVGCHDLLIAKQE